MKVLTEKLLKESKQKYRVALYFDVIAESPEKAELATQSLVDQIKDGAVIDRVNSIDKTTHVQYSHKDS